MQKTKEAQQPPLLRTKFGVDAERRFRLERAKAAENNKARKTKKR